MKRFYSSSMFDVVQKHEVISMQYVYIVSPAPLIEFFVIKQDVKQEAKQ
jgi:hypothetical protein